MRPFLPPWEFGSNFGSPSKTCAIMTQVENLETPAVTILLDRLEDNIARVQDMVARRGIGNRPHIKTHKIPAIAKMQMEAGAIGITCQKLGEAEVFADAKVCDDVLLTYNVVGGAKTERLMALAARLPRLAVVCDNEVVLRGISEAARSHGRDIGFSSSATPALGAMGYRRPMRRSTWRECS